MDKRDAAWLLLLTFAMLVLWKLARSDQHLDACGRYQRRFEYGVLDRRYTALMALEHCEQGGDDERAEYFRTYLKRTRGSE